LNDYIEKFWLSLTRFLPEELIMWCAIVVANYATSEIFPKTDIKTLTAVEAIRRWAGRIERLRDLNVEEVK
jgi:hypothetical protein